jgi:hypothetical protein
MILSETVRCRELGSNYGLFMPGLGRVQTTALHKRRSAIGFSNCKRNFGVTLATAATGRGRVKTQNRAPEIVSQLEAICINASVLLITYGRYCCPHVA